MCVLVLENTSSTDGHTQTTSKAQTNTKQKRREREREKEEQKKGRKNIPPSHSHIGTMRETTWIPLVSGNIFHLRQVKEQVQGVTWIVHWQVKNHVALMLAQRSLRIQMLMVRPFEREKEKKKAPLIGKKEKRQWNRVQVHVSKWMGETWRLEHTKG